MSGYLVYAIVEDRERPSGLSGFEGLELVPHGNVAAVVRSVDDAQIEDRRRQISDYNTIVDGLASAEPTIPVRFGTVVPDRDTVVRELLEPQAAYFAELLAELRGRAQYNVRALYHEDVVLAEVVATDP